MTRHEKLRRFAIIAYAVAQFLPADLRYLSGRTGEKSYSCGAWGWMMTLLSPVGACQALGDLSKHGTFAHGGDGWFNWGASQGFACLPGFAANLLFLAAIAVSFSRYKSWTAPASACAAGCAVVSAAAWYWTGIQDLSHIPFLGSAAWLTAMFLLAASSRPEVSIRHSN